MQTIKKISSLLSKREKSKIAYLTILMVIGGFLELLGVAGIFPLISAITEGKVSDINNITMLSLGLLCVYVIKNLFLMYMYSQVYKFVYDGRSKLATRLLEQYMKEDYEFHLGRNMAVIQRAVRSDVDGFYHLVRCLLQLMSELIICVVLAALLFVSDFWMALFLVVLLGLCVSTVVVISRKKAKKLGADDMVAGSKMNQWLMQGIGGIKEIKLLSREDYFVNSFKEYSDKSSDNQRKQQVLIQLPRLLTETVSIGAVLLWLVIAAAYGMDLLSIVPTLAVFAVAAFRLLPSVGKINGLLADYNFYRPRVDFIYEDMHGVQEITECNKSDDKIISFNESIELSDVSFAYAGTDKYILDKVSLSIARGESVGVVGPSGAGKTTLVDVIMGLLKTSAGDIKVDGVSVFEGLSSWQRLIGYVPQNIYLSDDSIRHNIAFGIPDEEIDGDRISECIKEARLSDLISELTDGVETVIGDRGIRLSGGQRQRIAIARALYFSPEVLVLDEATSSLDNDTEAAVMEAIEALHGKVTMIVVAHRLSTIEKCDKVYRVEDGKVTRQ